MLAAARRFARALATVPCDRTRVIGVVAHVDAGKTTLSEEMLALSGAITRSGRVDSGSTATDFLAQERARGITISSAAAHLDWRGTRVVLVDTPGHVDFGHDVDRALRVMDGVVLVVDAVAGAQARTEAVARAALETFGLPCVAVVNKMDRPGADFGKALASVAARCLPEGCAVVPVQRPVFDAAGAFAGPESALDAAAVADVDDAVADAYLADEAPDDAAVAAGLRRATLAGRAVPAVCAAALRGVGVAEVLDAVVAYLPSPREALAGDGAAAGDGFAGFVFKVAHDARRGPLAYARAYRGSARPKEVLASSTGAVERPGQFLTPLGGGLEPAESWDAGDIVVLTGLRSARAGDTLVGPKGSPGFDAARRGAGLRLEDVDAPPPVFAVAAEPGSPSAAKALEAAAAILARDDPSLVVDVDGDTGQVVLRGLGELHLEVALERLRSDFGVDVTFGPPAVALREAPTVETRRPPFVYDRTLGESRLFCALELSLAPRATDVDGEAVYGGGPPRISLAPAARDALDGASKLHGAAALAGIAAAATRGSLGGHALASCDITVEGAALDGDSSLGAVRAACAAALRDALDHAAPAVLEPVMRVDVAVPENRLGAVLDDLAAGRRARVVDVATAGGRATVVARAPLAELLGYATALRRVRTFLFEHHVTKDLQREIVNFYNWSFTAAQRDPPELGELPVILKMKLELALKQDTVVAVPLFRKLHATCVLGIVHNLKSGVALPTEILFAAGGEGTCSYVIGRGSVALSVPRNIEVFHRLRRMSRKRDSLVKRAILGDVEQNEPSADRLAGWRRTLAQFLANHKSFLVVETLQTKADAFGEAALIGCTHVTFARAETLSELNSLAVDDMRDLLTEFPDFARACRKMHRNRLEQCNALLEELGKADEAKGRAATPTSGPWGVGNFSDHGDKLVAASTIQRFYRGRGDPSFIEIVRDAARKHKEAKDRAAASPPREHRSHRPLARPAARRPPPSFLPAHLAPTRPRSGSDGSFGEEHHEAHRDHAYGYDLDSSRASRGSDFFY